METMQISKVSRINPKTKQKGFAAQVVTKKRIHDQFPEECKDPYVGSKDPSTGTHIAPTADGLKL